MTTMDVAALVLRLLVGLTLVAHGYNHLLGPGGWPVRPAGSVPWACDHRKHTRSSQVPGNSPAVPRSPSAS
jgi:hypothetical protein